MHPAARRLIGGFLEETKHGASVSQRRSEAQAVVRCRPIHRHPKFYQKRFMPMRHTRLIALLLALATAAAAWANPLRAATGEWPAGHRQGGRGGRRRWRTWSGTAPAAWTKASGTTGVAHVLEHMMFKGTPAAGPGEFNRRVAAAGGRDNAFTSRDYTAYFQQVPKQKLPK
jgi:zinc protease